MITRKEKIKALAELASGNRRPFDELEYFNEIPLFYNYCRIGDTYHIEGGRVLTEAQFLRFSNNERCPVFLKEITENEFFNL